jgi:Nickel responsive protein SCO4226-like
MPQYMVERHLPGITPEQLTAAAARAKSVTNEMTQQGKPVRYLRSTFRPKRNPFAYSTRHLPSVSKKPTSWRKFRSSAL